MIVCSMKLLLPLFLFCVLVVCGSRSAPAFGLVLIVTILENIHYKKKKSKITVCFMIYGVGVVVLGCSSVMCLNWLFLCGLIMPI